MDALSLEIKTKFEKLSLQELASDLRFTPKKFKRRKAEPLIVVEVTHWHPNLESQSRSVMRPKAGIVSRETSMKAGHARRHLESQGKPIRLCSGQPGFRSELFGRDQIETRIPALPPTLPP